MGVASHKNGRSTGMDVVKRTVYSKGYNDYKVNYIYKYVNECIY